MFDYLEELKKFNVNYVELTEKDFITNTKNKSSCIFHDKIKELISTQEHDIEQVYLVNHTNIEFIKQIVYSNKNHTIIYHPQTELLSIFDNNFLLLCELHSFEGNSLEQWIRGPNWTDDLDTMFRLRINLSNSNNAEFNIKPHSKRTNEFHCESSSKDNKLSLFVFKDDCVKVNYHLSVIKNMVFDLNGNLKSINLLDRISTQTHENIDGYKKVLEKSKEDLDFYTLCTDKVFTMMEENTFNKHIEFIFNIIEAHKKFNVDKIYQSTNFIVKHFNNLNILPSYSKLGFYNKRESNISKLLKHTEYEKYQNFEDCVEKKILIFLAHMKIKNNNLNTFLTPNIIDDIQFLNNSCDKIVNAGLKTIKKKKTLLNNLN